MMLQKPQKTGTVFSNWIIYKGKKDLNLNGEDLVLCVKVLFEFYELLYIWLQIPLGWN